MRGIMAYADTFCPPLHAVVRGADQINLALRRVIWNGQIMCAGDDKDLLRLKAILLEISQASDDTSRVFRDSIEDLYATVVSSSLQDLQAVSRLLIDIMDRSLYERRCAPVRHAGRDAGRSAQLRQRPGRTGTKHGAGRDRLRGSYRQERRARQHDPGARRGAYWRSVQGRLRRE
ncbi:MAG TPA: hypothetical protein VFG03_23210 [Telluria sp.]|nr:hypothetical protein [Telluria sp.]